MTRLDPAVADLLAAVHDALARPDWDPQAVYTARAAVYAVLRYPLTSPPGDVAAWVRDQTVEAADAGRVRSADRWDTYLAERG